MGGVIADVVRRVAITPNPQQLLSTMGRFAALNLRPIRPM